MTPLDLIFWALAVGVAVTVGALATFVAIRLIRHAVSPVEVHVVENQDDLDARYSDGYAHGFRLAKFESDQDWGASITSLNYIITPSQKEKLAKLEQAMTDAIEMQAAMRTAHPPLITEAEEEVAA